MVIQVVSATESKEQAKPAEGKAAPETQETEQKSASGEELDETTEASETSEDDSQDTEDQEGVEAAQDEEGAEEDGQESNDQKPGRKGQGFKKKIAKWRKRVSDLENEIQSLRQANLKYQAKPETESEAEPKKEAAKSDAEPNPDDYENHNDYVKAVAKWEIRQELKAEKTKEAEAAAKREFQESMDRFRDKALAFRETREDYDEVFQDIKDQRLSVTLQDCLLDAENGPELFYELAKNPDEFRRLNNLGVRETAREFGKFETLFNSKQGTSERKVEKKTTKAPPPIAPVGKGSTSAVRKSLHEVAAGGSQAEYDRLRDEQEKARARA